MTVRLVSSGPTRRRRTLGRVGLVALALLIVAGYSERWKWTGFSGEHLWDWLNLMLFPAVAVLLPEWVRRGVRFDARAGLITACGIGAFAIVVVGGYRWGWTWTGFAGNTFRDWLDLMIAPFLLPVVLKVAHTLHAQRPTKSVSSVTDGPALRGSLSRWEIGRKLAALARSDEDLGGDVI